MTTERLGSAECPLRVAVVGAGPAGFYTAEALTKRDEPAVSVDIFERLPAPYGLVRYGVAPDHQKIKSVTKAYDKTARHPRVRFLGNVRVGEGDLSIDELLLHYDQIVLSVGCETDRRLDVPGEDLAGSYAATSFVAWYNGHPSFQDYEVNLDAERAVIIGVGDVAMDLARMLSKSPESLATTDISDGALAVFEKSRVREVLVVARRGPGQAAFATKELEDIVDLPDVEVRVSPEDIQTGRVTEPTLDGLSKRKLAYLESLAARPRQDRPRIVVLRFCQSPVRILGTGGRVSGIELERNRLEVSANGRVSARGTGERETIPVGLVLRSVGYRGVPLDGVPFHEAWGTIPNDGGRVTRDGQPWPRVYCSGWIKRGPSGVIGTNKADAAETAAAMLADASKMPAGDRGPKTPDAIDDLLKSRGVRVISFNDWKIIDEAEIRAGQSSGRIRRKMTRLEEMLGVLPK